MPWLILFRQDFGRPPPMNKGKGRRDGPPEKRMYDEGTALGIQSSLLPLIVIQ